VLKPPSCGTEQLAQTILVRREIWELSGDPANLSAIATAFSASVIKVLSPTLRAGTHLILFLISLVKLKKNLWPESANNILKRIVF
jgi:hypothetical protein